MSLYYYHFSYNVAADWHIDEVYMFRSMPNKISFVLYFMKVNALNDES